MKQDARWLWPAMALLLQLLSSNSASACSPLVDDRGRVATPIVEPGSAMFIGTLISVRTPDYREIELIRAQWDFSPRRRAEPDEKLIDRFSNFVRIAKFEIRQDSPSAQPTTMSLWFQADGNCPGPFNEGLPVEVGQTTVVFWDTLHGAPTGWIPNLVSVERLNTQLYRATMRRLFEDFEQCADDNPNLRYDTPTAYLRAPESGFGRGCLAHLR